MRLCLLVLALLLGTEAQARLGRTSIRAALSKRFPTGAGSKKALFVAALTGDCEGTAATATTGHSISFSRASTAFCVKANGTMVSVASGAPRLTQYGLLVEPSGINQALRAQEFNSASWIIGGSTTKGTADSVVAPTNASVAEPVTYTGATTDSVYQNLTVVAATQYTASVYVKVASGTGTFYLSRTNCASWATATVGGPFTATTSWQRFTTTYTSAAGETCSGLVIGSNGKTPAAATATTFHLWGAQHELGPVATSVVITAGTSATRNAEAASVAGVTLPVADGCIAATFRSQSPSPTSGQRIVGFASTDAPLYVVSNTSLGYLTAGAAGDTTITVPALQNRNVRAIASWSSGANYNRLTADAVTGTVDYGAFGAGTTLYLGSQGGSASFANGFISTVALYATPGACS